MYKIIGIYIKNRRLGEFNRRKAKNMIPDNVVQTDEEYNEEHF